MTTLASLSPRRRVLLVIVQGLVLMALLAAILMIAAGSTAWPRGWLLIGVYAVCFFTSSTILMLRVPELMDERRKKHPNVKRWDRPLVLAYQALYFPTFIVSGLDRRYDWSHVPAGISLIALVLIVVFFWLITWAPLANAHLETYVRIQTERDHRVCDTGPYRVIRHPAYVGLALFFVALPLSLGSLGGLVPGAAAVVLLIIRTGLEDRTLQRELPGYADYAQRVRFRWIPGIW